MNLTIDEVKSRINELYRLGLDYDRALARLQRVAAVAASSPESKRRYDEIMAKGGGIKRAISDGVQAVQNVYAWVKEKIGINLGVLPLVPIAVVSGVIAAIAAAKAWIDEANNEARRLEIIATLPPEQRAKALTVQTPTVTGNLATLGMWLALGAVAIFVLPKLIKGR